MPALRFLLGGAAPLAGSLGAEPRHSPSAAARAIDATLGVPGLPQSGTGQTALLTGRNAAALLGRHFGPWVPTALRDLLATENVFRRLRDRGVPVALANAYPAAQYPRDRLPDRRPGAVPLAAIAAGILTRDERSLQSGDALVSSITTDGWRRHVDPGAPVVQPREAGHRLARISQGSALTFFAHFDTDYVGHRGAFADAVGVLERLDRAIGGVLERVGSDTLLLITSDHGNIEDTSGEHTNNPVPLIATGPGSRALVERVSRIDEIAPVLEEILLRDGPHLDRRGGAEEDVPT